MSKPEQILAIEPATELKFVGMYFIGFVLFLRSVGARVARSPVFSGSSRISAPISRLPERSQNLPYLTRHSLASEINVLETFCSLLIVHSTFFYRASAY